MTNPTVPTVTDELIRRLEQEITVSVSLRCPASIDPVHLSALLAERADLKQQLAAAITAENCELFRKDVERMNIEAAAKKLAESMDYPWHFMPDKGRNEMRRHAQAVVDAARAIADT